MQVHFRGNGWQETEKIEQINKYSGLMESDPQKFDVPAANVMIPASRNVTLVAEIDNLWVRDPRASMPQ